MLNDYCIFSKEVADLKTEAIINMINPCRRFFSLQTSLSHPIPITLTRVLNRLHAGSHSTNTVRCPTVGEEGPPWYTLPEQARRRRSQSVCPGLHGTLTLSGTLGCWRWPASQSWDSSCCPGSWALCTLGRTWASASFPSPGSPPTRWPVAWCRCPGARSLSGARSVKKYNFDDDSHSKITSHELFLTAVDVSAFPLN